MTFGGSRDEHCGVPLPALISFAWLIGGMVISIRLPSSYLVGCDRRTGEPSHLGSGLFPAMTERTDSND
jgi:hypothetical protein